MGPEEARLLCRCLGIASHRVEAAIEREGLASVEEVAKGSGAGSGCGLCHPEIEELLARSRGEEVDPALARENRLVCQLETQARVWGAFESGLGRRLLDAGFELETLHVDGLRVRIELRGREASEIAPALAEALCREVCADLVVDVIGVAQR